MVVYGQTILAELCVEMPYHIELAKFRNFKIYRFVLLY